jgi:hypothetical protein
MKSKFLPFLYPGILNSALVFLFLFNPLYSQESSSKLEFLRLTETALQTPIYTLSNRDSSIRVKIIGVIHVGDLGYYQELKKIIRDLDFLFYEGIRMTKSSKSINIPYGVKNEPEKTKQDVKTFTNLQNQIAISFKFVEQADYLRPESNWINADVNLNQFTEILQKTNLSLEDLSRNLSLDNRNIFEQDNESRETLKYDPDQNKLLRWYKRKMAVYLVKSAKDLCFNEEMNKQGYTVVPLLKHFDEKHEHETFTDKREENILNYTHTRII